MAPSVSSSKLTLTYPIFAADFLDATRFIVGGGGGEGRSGVGNKIVTLLTLLDASNPAEITQISEHTLSRDEDSCMSLGIAQPANPSSPPVILAGVNSSEAILESGHNEHFRTIPIVKASSGSLDISSAVGATRRQIFTSITSKEMYQRVLRTKAGTVAIANGGGIATSKDYEIIVAASDTLQVLKKIPLPSEAADLDLDDDGENLVYCTAKEIFTMHRKENPRKITTPPGEGNIRSARWLPFSPPRILITRNRPGRSGIDMYLLDPDTGSVISKHPLPKTAKAATSLDTTSLNATATLAAVSAADQSIYLFHIIPNKILPAKHFTDVHPHQITKLAFSRAAALQPVSSDSSVYGDTDEKDTPEEEERHIVRLASTSIGNTIVVHTIPVSGGRVMSKSAGLTQTSVSLVAVVFFAILLQYVFLTRAGFSGLSVSPAMKEAWGDVVARLRGESGGDSGVTAEHGAPFEDLEGRSLEDDLWVEKERRPVESAEDWHRRPMGDSVEDVD
ncbi:hypothetical protein EX30DRAFT_392661 [Ascodesmis nigricans]|uniref:Guanine nucleotide-exchange factor SEC12 n=1 Tax=Ascodesmis nigricans TaxID=341454 RepID=A0A4S2N7R4_9PEZI|nr:hypothetical protein EX30DRAFT_392661 [Ascodesmis nigricans]